jgi:hypothetical protein
LLQIAKDHARSVVDITGIVAALLRCMTMTMKSTSIVLGTLLLSGASLSAQSRNNRIPPGQQPPAGECRVWYDDLPAGRQPRPMDCRTAETIASRDRSARVIYGSGTREGWGYGQYPSTRDGRSIPRSPSSRSGTYYNNVAFNNGYTDGVEKGREDVSERRAYDPSRHSRYRSADHLYDRQYGSKDQYKSDYRQGFIDGYDAAFDRGSTVRVR